MRAVTARYSRRAFVVSRAVALTQRKARREQMYCIALKKKKRKKKIKIARPCVPAHLYIASAPPPLFFFQKATTTSPPHNIATSLNCKYFARRPPLPPLPPSLRFSPLDYLSRCGVSRPLIPPCFELGRRLALSRLGLREQLWERCRKRRR